MNCTCDITPIDSGTEAAVNEYKLGPGSTEPAAGFPAPGKTEAHYGGLYRLLELEQWLPHVLTELDDGDPGWKMRQHFTTRPIMRQRGYCEECIDRAIYGKRNPDALIGNANDMADGLDREEDRWQAARMLAEHAAGTYNAYEGAPAG